LSISYFLSSGCHKECVQEEGDRMGPAQWIQCSNGNMFIEESVSIEWSYQNVGLV